MLILLALLNLPAEEQGIYLETSSVLTVILFVWQAPKASATQEGLNQQQYASSLMNVTTNT